MFRTRYVCLILLLAAALLPINLMGRANLSGTYKDSSRKFDTQKLLAGFAHAAFAADNGDVRVNKPISFAELKKYRSIKVLARSGGSEVEYEGVPLRVLVSELMPELNLDTSTGWRALVQKKLVAELSSEDGYPGLVTSLEVATDKDGDRYIIATRRDGKQIENGPRLICRLDTARTRWVENVVQLRLVEVPGAEETESAK